MAGAWSDRHGRRPIIALPIFGQVLLNVTFVRVQNNYISQSISYKKKD